MSDDKKVGKEQVLCTDKNGTPHVTFDAEARVLHHYARGCPGEQKRREAARAKHAGPAQVATDDYRRGWDAIDWGVSPKGLPS